MAFDVYPDPPAAPLAVGPGGASPFIGFQERAQLDPVAGATKMYVAVAVSGDARTPPGPPLPSIALQAESGTAVAVSDGQPAMITGSGGDLVGWASASAADGVTLVEIELARRSTSWQIKFANPDPNALRRLTWVVADNAAETRQPWVDAPTALGFAVTPVAQLTTAEVLVANRGTAPLTIADRVGLPLGPGFFLVAVPGPTDPGACGTVLVRFVGMHRGSFTGTYSISSNDAGASQAAGHNHLVNLTAVVP